ncbi:MULTISPECIES: hypothetical protein [Paenibacillus]|uniref:hypothetical protein n=1 Tax=Paenibacillus TaxID=44249 RepID=UPI000896E40E|nr:MULTISPECIES: hypothetical protein [Paenibacillus]MCZ1269260.1 hypothetical protein [Paenibacillus tundrae]SEB27623.1 hypothetical protein SAMN03159332_6291 [Paenibacillus sp. 276b]SLK16203.1 hypothetical protein SAMN06272722_11097 [Paenibacillus sp. RU5A]SOC74250.1 hypothetical protein SAMN05880581_11097 [Paenibacillus sp. RU26A]SOC76400.1 hypothetical protein SAMN05880586_11097 [Paenibacillus sp. RU5M]
MGRNFLKINSIEYRMVSDPDETDQEMIDNGYIKATDAQFDKAFNSYQNLMNNEVTYSDILKEIEILT